MSQGAGFELQRLRSIRARGLKLVVPFLPIIVLGVITINRVWAYAIFVAWGLIWGTALVRLTLRIRRTG